MYTFELARVYVAVSTRGGKIGAHMLRPDFTKTEDAQLREYWLDRNDGELSWFIAVEDELIRRGYRTRDNGEIVPAHRPQSGDGPEALKDLLTF